MAKAPALSDLTSSQLRRLADQLLDETSERGIFVQMAAASKVRELRLMANAKDRSGSHPLTQEGQ